jgi:threonyl-tRNA synthetase
MSLPQNSQNIVLDTKRHSFAHLMAAAVKQYFEKVPLARGQATGLEVVQFGVGPVIETGCYYDFILPRTLIPEDLPLIEEKIKELMKRNLVFKVQEMELNEAITLFENAGQPLKVELLNDLATRGTTSMSEEEKADFEGNAKNLVYRIISKSEYESIKGNSEYSPQEITTDRFIHLSNYDQIVKIANLKMNPNEECFLLNISTDKLNNSEFLKNEDLYNSGENFPHLYGKLNMDAVVKVDRLNYDKNQNSFVLPKTLPTITIYRLVDESTGEIVFEDLCKGPHVNHIKELRSCGFSLDKFSASYWRGDQERDIRMQRIYALVFETRDELKKYQNAREEAKKRDHRLIGEQMDLFTFSDLIGPGLPIWLPKGRTIQMLLEKWAEQTEKEWGYQFVSTPIITKENLFYTSTHLPHYKDSMYSAMDIDGEKYYIKPMNCPFHHQAFAARSHSYRDLPLRLSEYGFCHRYEDSGSLFGLMRVRSMKMNDAHLYCSRDQAVQEFVNVIKLHQYYYDVLGIKDYFMELALRNPENDKYHGDEQMWQDAEQMTKEAMEIAGVPFVIEKDGAAFYGPKVDFQIKSSIGRAFTASTNQIDLFMPSRFGLEFTNEKGEKETPVVIHRAPLGTHERFIGFLIEHFAGRFPFWLAPTQIKILTINDQVLPYVEKIKEILNETVLMKPLKYNEIRFEVDDRSESLGKKIREATNQKIPVMLIVGPKDVEAGEVSVRTQEGEQKVKLEGLGEFLKSLG